MSASDFAAGNLGLSTTIPRLRFGLGRIEQEETKETEFGILVFLRFLRDLLFKLF